MCSTEHMTAVSCCGACLYLGPQAAGLPNSPSVSYTLQEALAPQANTEGDDALGIVDNGASQAPLEVKRILTPSLHLLLPLHACVSELI